MNVAVSVVDEVVSVAPARWTNVTDAGEGDGLGDELGEGDGLGDGEGGGDGDGLGEGEGDGLGEGDADGDGEGEGDGAGDGNVYVCVSNATPFSSIGLTCTVSPETVTSRKW